MALIVSFVDEQCARGDAIGSLCSVLRGHGVQVAAPNYQDARMRVASVRDRSDAVVIDALLATTGTPEGMFGRRMADSRLRRQGLPPSANQADRLMGELGPNGHVRGRGARATIADCNAERAQLLPDRDFTAPAPSIRWVVESTEVCTWAGFAYVSFAIDCYSRAIVGWHASMSKTTPLVTTALRMGLWRRDRAGHTAGDGLVHHSDAGSQFTSVSFAEILALGGIAALIGSIGDAYDNALAESTVGLFKNEAICDDSPFRDGPLKRLEAIEWVTLAWVDWYNQHGLYSRLGEFPTDEFESAFYADVTTPGPSVLASAYTWHEARDGSAIRLSGWQIGVGQVSASRFWVVVCRVLTSYNEGAIESWGSEW